MQLCKLEYTPSQFRNSQPLIFRSCASQGLFFPVSEIRSHSFSTTAQVRIGSLPIPKFAAPQFPQLPKLIASTLGSVRTAAAQVELYTRLVQEPAATSSLTIMGTALPYPKFAATIPLAMIGSALLTVQTVHQPRHPGEFHMCSYLTAFTNDPLPLGCKMRTECQALSTEMAKFESALVHQRQRPVRLNRSRHLAP